MLSFSIIISIIRFRKFLSKLQHKEKGYFFKHSSFSSLINSKLPYRFKKEEYS